MIHGPSMTDQISWFRLLCAAGRSPLGAAGGTGVPLIGQALALCLGTDGEAVNECGFHILGLLGNDDGILFAGTLWPFLYLFR